MAPDKEKNHSHSIASSLTEKENHSAEGRQSALSVGHGQSAVHSGKVEEAREDNDDDWEHDPENARNWPALKKWTAVCVVSFYTFVPPLASSMMAPGIPEIAIRFGITNQTLIAMTLSIFLLSFGIGPLILSPLSEMYGRALVLHIGNIFSLGFSIGCAFAPNTASFIIFRFLAGFSGSAPVGIGGGSVGDLFTERDRASAMAIWSLGPLLGPVVGPVAGGFIAQTIGVKYVFVVIAGVCAVASIVGIPLLRETYAPVIRMRRALKAGDRAKAMKVHPIFMDPNQSKLRILWINLERPFEILFRSSICFILSLYMAFMYGIFYLMFATFAEFFAETYHFSPGVGGLAYLGLGVGFFIATIFGAKFADGVYKYLADKNGGQGKPEMRIPALAIGSLFVPIGLFWYGWTAAAKTHWILPIIGSGIFGFGMMTCFLPISLYLVDTFTFSASALAACAMFRCMLGFAFPLFGKQMFDTLGMGPGNSLLGGLAIVLGIPFPVWLYFNGETLRASNPLTVDSTKPKKQN
ncbi:multidrug resistance protein 4 [Crepidotus variabilis]|uniref:Multidrug resistance protein 4 n=1 Tax=Crepidotus variabilis TaxID=179855 RepID=A0A9P6JRH6_9AGAR|nr:multidrug resistance protein 4 [Crepidotus variabilis]